jgi:Family of unknown function (DUF5684)
MRKIGVILPLLGFAFAQDDLSTRGQIPGIVWVIYIAVIALMLVSMWKLFTKAGKPGWASIVPLYNTVVMLEIAGKPLWWFFMFFVPIANIVFAFLALYHFSKAYGKGDGFSIGVALLSLIFMPLLAFSDAKYQGPATA